MSAETDILKRAEQALIYSESLRFDHQQLSRRFALLRKDFQRAKRHPVAMNKIVESRRADRHRLEEERRFWL
jgi:hypothetical protein